MDISEILKNTLSGTKLYSPIFGEVTLKSVYNNEISVIDNTNIVRGFYNNGNFYKDGECMLFLSRENRDWNTFKKFDINTLKPFDKVLTRDNGNEVWNCNLFSHIYRDYGEIKFRGIDTYWFQCIPYNDGTKHLVGTDEDCPEYYKTW